MSSIHIVPGIIAVLTGFISLSIKSDKYKRLCHIVRKNTFILEPVVIQAFEPTSWFSW